MAYIGKSPDGTGVRSRFYYTQTSGGGTSVSGSSDDGTTLTFSDGAYVDVFLNGVLLVAGTDYNTNTANTISGLAALASGDVVEVVVYDIFTVADTVSASQGGTFNASVTIADDLTVDTDTLHVDSTNNRLGVGTVSPSELLHVDGTIRSGSGTAADPSIKVGDNNTGFYYIGSNALGMTNDGSESLRVDGSGNLLVGTTSNNTANVGHGILANGFAYHTRDSSKALIANRKTDDGPIIEVRKNDSTAGYIQCIGTRIALSSQGGDGGLAIAGTEAYNWSANNFYPSVDNAKDLGINIRRWDDIHATNSTIQTSDQNEKQQIASLTAAEITAAKAISKLFKTFKWNSAVAAKGDAARTHTGHIAQEVQTAMTDAGLDAADYAFWCSDTYWEAAGTTYATADEAPEGATQRTRLGIRYPELLAFIGAATEQRLADIETRLTALENAE